ncbi:hypothetical protein HY993_02160 [Candidatus Micrarchaeota archaeon]|nr:hypothetical protein [Candidatus Micrarchaeota archaeon]
MSLYGYSAKIGENQVPAQAYDLNCSYKDLTQVARAVKNKPVRIARKILQNAIDKAMPIRYFTYNTRIGHRPQLGGQKGRYPIKEAKMALKLLNSAVSNALNKGFDEKNLFVKTAAAYKQNTIPRYKRFFATSVTLGYGRQAIRADYETARLELILESKEPAVKREARRAGAKPAEKTVEKPSEKKAEEKKPEARKEIKADEKKGEKPQAKKEEQKPAEKKPVEKADKASPVKVQQPIKTNVEVSDAERLMLGKQKQ